ncbi:phage major capsid protein, HK97 family [Filomicrobium insigne]|uniref:Phage major capsid protein, HK97 family n=1 Tax=Filomicrobium insigne TaxID=418854 RepID=A0A1H0SFU9_9HYPH|nr:phage major capsid protein [Filomicrobium insigne]SDP40389.1 phage major capsid protein, HK97 family [Filomicrobium insigne]
MSDRTEELLKQVEKEIGRIGDDVKRVAEDALKQSKDAGTVSAEAKARADELLVKQKLLDEGQQKLLKKLEDLETRNHDVEQKLAGRRGGGGGDKPKSPGQQVADSDGLKTFVANGAKGTVKVPVTMAITSDSGSPGSAGALIWSDREREIVRIPRRTMTIRQLLTQGRTGSSSVEYAKQIVRDNQAAPVAEGAQKPESNYIWDRADALVRTVAHWIHVSRQALEDADQLQTEIDGELRYGLDLVEEAQLLKGSGAGQDLPGLITQATAYQPAFTPAAEQRIDVLRLALLQASLNEFPADGIVLNDIDWAAIELLKDGENRYLWANPRGINAPGLWGRPIVQTQSMDVDEFLVGAFMTAATIYDRMDAEVVISDQDRDNFIKNMLTIRAEKRLALAVKRPAALVTGEFGAVTG